MSRLPLLLLVTLATASPAAAGTTISSAEYARTLSRVAADLERAAGAAKGGRARAAEALRGLPERVTVGEGTASATTSVDNRELLGALQAMVKGGPTGIRQARAAVESLRQAVAQAGPAPPGQARHVLASVLAGGEFRPSWWEARQKQLMGRVLRFLRQIWPHIHWRWPRWVPRVSPKVWRGAGIAMLVACSALAIFLLARLFSRLSPRVPPEGVAPAARARVILPCGAWLEEAGRLERAGDHRGAVRALHMAALMKLDEAGLVRYHTAYTDGRFVRALQAGGRGEVARALAGLNHLFARTWYGRAPAGTEEYASAQQLWGEVEGLASP